MELLNNESWSHLVLQGQKYSVSESVSYPTNAARYLVELAKSQQTTPILFPEHALQGNFREGEYIYEIMQKIQQQNHACLAPIPHAWRLALTLHPELQLHESDGNHASLQGAFLTALVLYEVITGSPADQLPDIKEIALTAQVQQLLRQQASNSMQQYPACQP
jgi:LysM repeat protein